MANPMLPRKPQEIGPFRAGTKPVRVGVYRTKPQDRYLRGTVFQYWDGGRWHWYMPTAEQAAYYSDAGTISSFQSPRWWGLAEEAI